MPAAFEWKEFRDPGGRYTVLLPGTPKEESPGTFTVRAVGLGALTGNASSYSFIVTYDKREKEERTWEEQVKDWREANTDPEFKPLKDQAIKVKGHPGWEIVYKKPKEEFVRTEEALVRAWIVKLNQDVAMVSVEVPDTPDWLAAAEKFLDSLTPTGK